MCYKLKKKCPLIVMCKYFGIKSTIVKNIENRKQKYLLTKPTQTLPHFNLFVNFFKFSDFFYSSQSTLSKPLFNNFHGFVFSLRRYATITSTELFKVRPPKIYLLVVSCNYLQWLELFSHK